MDGPAALDGLAVRAVQATPADVPEVVAAAAQARLAGAAGCRAVSPPQFDAGFRAQLLELFRWRRDVRHFRRDALPEGLLDRLIAAADLSPSVGLSQPWRFVTVDDPACRAAVRASFAASNAAALAGQCASGGETGGRRRMHG